MPSLACRTKLPRTGSTSASSASSATSSLSLMTSPPFCSRVTTARSSRATRSPSTWRAARRWPSRASRGSSAGRRAPWRCTRRAWRAMGITDLQGHLFVPHPSHSPCSFSDSEPSLHSSSSTLSSSTPPPPSSFHFSPTPFCRRELFCLVSFVGAVSPAPSFRPAHPEYPIPLYDAAHGAAIPLRFFSADPIPVIQSSVLRGWGFF